MGTIPAHDTPPSPPPDAPVCVVVVTGSAPLRPACDRRRATRCLRRRRRRRARPRPRRRARPRPARRRPRLDQPGRAGVGRRARTGRASPRRQDVHRHRAGPGARRSALARSRAARRRRRRPPRPRPRRARSPRRTVARAGSPRSRGGGAPTTCASARPGRPVTLDGRARHHVLGARGPRRVRRRHGHRCPLAAHRRDARPARRTRRVERGDRAVGRRRRRRRHRHRARARSPAVRRGPAIGDARRGAAACFAVTRAGVGDQPTAAT